MMKWKKIVFAIAICLLYIPMVFMAVNTFFPKTSVNECYTPYRSGPVMPEKASETQMNEYNAKIAEYDAAIMKCNNSFEIERKHYDSWKFIVIMVLNILVALVMLLNIDKSVIFGLFFGVIITAFTATIRYMESSSIVGFILLVCLFGMVVYFVNSRGRNEKE